MGIAEDIIIIVIAGLIAGLITNKLKIPSIIGYIIAGIIIGPYTGGVTVTDIPRIELLAEIGVALLLFSIGLGFSFKELRDIKAIALIGAPIQIIVTIIYGSLIGHFLGFSWNESVILGMILSLSSTMVVMKMLMGRNLMGTLSSKVMIGILIIQDIAAIPLMIIIPNLNNVSGSFNGSFFSILKAVIILSVIVLVGTRIIPLLLKFAAKLNSREFFLITITAICLGIGYLTHYFGLSLAFGAFVAGMMINHSEYSHKALSDIVPLRDIFGLVFFTSIGMLLDLSFLMKNYPVILLLVALVFAGKFFIFIFLGIAFKYRNIIPLALGLGLSQIGEFSFVLARVGLQNKVIDGNFYSLVLAVSIITMIATPFLSLLAGPIYSLKRKSFKRELLPAINLPTGKLSGHAVIAGGGRVGFQVASVLHNLNLPCIVIEQDYHNFEKCKNVGLPIIYGDASQDVVLEASSIGLSRLLIITTPDIAVIREIISVAIRQNPDIRIIARTDTLQYIDELRTLHVSEIVQPEFEASLELIRQSLLHLNYPVSAIQMIADEIRGKNYTPLYDGNMQLQVMSKIKNTPFLLETTWIELPENSPVSGKSIGELAIRTRTGVSIVGVMRGGKFIPNPDADFIFKPGDIVCVIGIYEGKKIFAEICGSDISSVRYLP